jgi:poly-gamma-glutamate biosynthesis protein PgsC/CapC
MLPLDPVSSSIAVGLVVSLLFAELFGLAAGGMVVPGYLALSLDRPADIALTLGAALLTYLVVSGISKVTIVYGRRRIVMMLLFGFMIGAAIRATPVFATGAALPDAGAGIDASVIGFIIPGLIAVWFDRQGVVSTCSVLMITAVVVRLVLILVGMEMVA